MRPRLYIALALLLPIFACSDKKPTTPIKYPDQTPPAKISSLWICVEDPTWADLCWYAPGDDSLTGKATAYEIRYSRTPITDSTWDSCAIATQSLVPRDPTTGERFRLTGLDSGATYFAALKAVDDLGNWSALSNVVAINAVDSMPPRTITDLTGVLLDDSTYQLLWTAPSDSDVTAKVGSYEIRYSLDTIDEDNWSSANLLGQYPTPLTPGQTQSVTLTWPVIDTLLYFVVRSRDVRGNQSALSNLYLARNPGGIIVIPPDSSIGIDTLWTAESGLLPGLVPSSMLATADNGLVIACKYYDGISNDIVVLRLDSLGQQLWETRLGGSGHEYPAKMLSLPNGQFLVVGSSSSCTDTTSDIYLAWFDANGTVSKEVCFGASGSESVASAALCPDGGITIAGSTTAGVPEYSGFVLKTDPQGNELWRQHYTVFNQCGEANGPPSVSFRGIAVNSSGSIIVFGRAAYFPYGSGHTGGCDPVVEWAFFKAWSQFGDSLWHSTVASPYWGDIIQGGNMAMLADGSIAYIKVQESESWYPQVCLFRPDGGRGWANLLPIETDYKEIRLAPTPIANGVIVAANLAESVYPPADNIGIILLNNLGSQLAAMSFGQAGSSETVRALTQLPNNSFAFAWTKPSSVSGRIFVTKARITTVIH